MQFAVDACTANRRERTRIARLALHIAKEGLPAAVGMADGVPHPPTFGDPTDVQFPVDACTANSPKRTGIARLALHVPEERLPAAIGMADGVPHPPTFGNSTDVQFPVDTCTADRVKDAGGRHLPFDVIKERLPAAIGMADGVPHGMRKNSRAPDPSPPDARHEQLGCRIDVQRSDFPVW